MQPYWPQWQGPDRTRLSKETGLLKEWPANGPSVVWTATGLGPATDRWRLRAIASSSKARAAATALSSPSIARMARKSGRRRWAVPDRRPRTGAARHADGRRRSDLRAQRERRSGVPQDRWHRGVAAQYPPRVQGPAAAMADQRVPAGRRAACHRVSRRAGRRHGEARQDDGNTVWTSKDLSDPAGYSSVIAADVQGVRTY